MRKSVHLVGHSHIYESTMHVSENLETLAHILLTVAVSTRFAHKEKRKRE
jgi:hypothetical protein